MQNCKNPNWFYNNKKDEIKDTYSFSFELVDTHLQLWVSGQMKAEIDLAPIIPQTPTSKSSTSKKKKTD